MSSKTKTAGTKEEATPAPVPRLRFPEFRGAEGWKEKRLGNEGEFLSSLTGKAGGDFDVGEARFVTYMNVFSNTFVDPKGLRLVDVKEGENQNAVASGDVFFTVSSETPEEVGMSSVLLEDLENCYLNSFCALFRFSKGKRPNPVFTGYLLRQPLVRDYFTKKAQGITRFNLSKDAFRSLPFFVPSPAEQQKIAECLSSVDELMAAQAQKVGALKTHKKGLMQQLFPREGETQPRLRFPEFQNAGEWVVSDLGSLSDVRDGTHDSPAFSTTGRPLVTSKNLRPDGTLDLENVSLISEEDYEQINKRSKVAVGDILFGMIGTIGNPVLLKSEGFAIKNVALIKELGPLSNAFVVQLLQSDYVAAIFAMLNTGNSQKFIALGKIRELPVPVPSLPEQQRIASCLSSLDALITAETQKLEALKTHKKGLMQQLFPSPEAVEA